MFYLKYRPQKITDLDLKEIRETLAKILISPSLPHAFLFSGPKGAGKTSAARIIAKVVNCFNRRPDEYEPCGYCDNCKSITQGNFLDLIEIDAASNRGIDDIRELRERVKLAPSRGKYKVYIVDEVHMLTTEAFNALLKTLEEPPSHVVFILCTTEPQKLPQTVVSRCIHLKFRKGRKEEIIRSLQKVIKGEKLSVEDGVLEKIAESVDGSFRDAQKILEKLSLEGKKITLSLTEKELGYLANLNPEDLLQHLAQRDIQKGLEEISKVLEYGVDLKEYLLEVLNILRESLLSYYQSPTFKWYLSKKEIVLLIKLLSEASMEIKTSIIPQLPLEVAIIEWFEKTKDN
jgi:DNA polymerase-3 subunit gamma/tau